MTDTDFKILNRVSDAYKLNMEFDAELHCWAVSGNEGPVEFHWSAKNNSLLSFFDELREYFEEIGAAKVLRHC